jgi:hypothetical protein
VWSPIITFRLTASLDYVNLKLFMCVKVTINCRLLFSYVNVCDCVGVCVFVYVLCVMPMMDLQASSIHLCGCVCV